MSIGKSLLCFTLLAICPISVAAQTGNYFPLETGNAWMFSASATGTDISFRVISVEGRETLNGVDYSRVRYFERIVYLRSNTDGSIVSLNRATGREEPWLRLADPVGTTFEAHIDDCTQSGRIDGRGGEVITPAGRFINTIQIGFQGNCADAGPIRQFYTSGIGPVVHEETSFAGPRRYELVYFRVGSVTGGGPELSFTIGLNALQYLAGAKMDVRLSLRSTLPDPLRLRFVGGQSFELKIYNGRGDIVYVWSADKLFTSIIRDESFGPGERTYGFAVPLGTLPPGQYKVQGFLTTTPQMYLGETVFEIVP